MSYCRKLFFALLLLKNVKVCHTAITLNFVYLQAVFKQEEVDSSVGCKQVLSDKAGEELNLI